MKTCFMNHARMMGLWGLMHGVSIAWGGDPAQASQPAPSWSATIEPILNDHCVKCHGPLKKKADLDLSTFHGLIRGGESGSILKAGQPDASLLYQVVLPESDPHMPPEKQLDEASVASLHDWITQFRELPTDQPISENLEPSDSPRAPRISALPSSAPAVTSPEF